jgi:hypothetical protein
MISGMRQGLTAAPGWDAVTGFGSINFERMLRYVLPGSDAVSIASRNKDAAMVADAAASTAAAAASAAAASAASIASATAEVKTEAETSKSIAGKDLFPLLLPCHIIRNFRQIANLTNVFFIISRGHRPIVHSFGFEYFSVLEGAGYPFVFSFHIHQCSCLHA